MLRRDVTSPRSLNVDDADTLSEDGLFFRQDGHFTWLFRVEVMDDRVNGRLFRRTSAFFRVYEGANEDDVAFCGWYQVNGWADVFNEDDAWRFGFNVCFIFDDRLFSSLIFLYIRRDLRLFFDYVFQDLFFRSVRGGQRVRIYDRLNCCTFRFNYQLASHFRCIVVDRVRARYANFLYQYTRFDDLTGQRRVLSVARVCFCFAYEGAVEGVEVQRVLRRLGYLLFRLLDRRIFQDLAYCGDNFFDLFNFFTYFLNSITKDRSGRWYYCNRRTWCALFRVMWFGGLLFQILGFIPFRRASQGLYRCDSGQRWYGRACGRWVGFVDEGVVSNPVFFVTMRDNASRAIIELRVGLPSH